jgi:ATP-dependent Clp protease adaptor protein ClpS
VTLPPSTPITDVPTTRKITFDLSEMEPWREFAVILFDDEEHSQDEVISQLMKALECSMGRAAFLMHQVEEANKATIAIVSREKAVYISRILRQIELQVELRQIN